MARIRAILLQCHKVVPRKILSSNSIPFYQVEMRLSPQIGLKIYLMDSQCRSLDTLAQVLKVK